MARPPVVVKDRQAAFRLDGGPGRSFLRLLYLPTVFSFHRLQNTQSVQRDTPWLDPSSEPSLSSGLPCALLESNLKTKKSAFDKRPPDETHGPGEETIRPQQSSEAWGSREKKVAPLDLSDLKNSTSFRHEFS